MPLSKHSASLRQESDETPTQKLDKKMAQLALKQKEKDAQDLAQSQGLPYINLVGLPIPPGPLEVIQEEDARKYGMVCFNERSGEKDIAVLDLGREEVKELLHSIASASHGEVVPFITSQASLDSALKLYAMLPKTIPSVEGVRITQEEIERYSKGVSDIKKLNEQIQAVSLTEVVALVIAAALSIGASDIHIEAEERTVIVRFRIDGVLHEVANLSIESFPRIIARVKLLAGVKINVMDRPQDGRFTIHLGEDEIDVRVSMIPTAFGESVVMRLLRGSSAGISFEQLGLHPYVSKLLKKEIGKPNGMIITTGPTGSGKTTTLYAILNELNTPEIKIITLEDPIEYKLKGLNQSQVDPSRNYTFATGLKSILRQDPDVVMVGEIRDLETADITINAALTGHLVISTIHTNSAAGAIPRFIALGTKPFLLGPALNLIMGQRLVRRLCSECKEEQILAPETMERVKKYLAKIPAASGVVVNMNALTFWHSRGCDACHGIGYKGRIGIYEILPMNTEIEQSISSGEVSESKIEDIAIRGGMVTMVQDGLLWALEGVTSVSEVFEAAQ